MTMRPIKRISNGHIVCGDRDIVDAQITQGFTDDGAFYRTAVLCSDQHDESIDIVTAEGVHLARINIHGYGYYPSIDVIPTRDYRVDARNLGERLIDERSLPGMTSVVSVVISQE